MTTNRREILSDMVAEAEAAGFYDASTNQLIAEWLERGRTNPVVIEDSATLEHEDDHDSRTDWLQSEDLG